MSGAAAHETPAAKRRRSGLEAAIAVEVEAAIAAKAHIIAEDYLKFTFSHEKRVSEEQKDVIAGVLAGLAHFKKLSPAQISAALGKCAELHSRVNVALCGDAYVFSASFVKVSLVFKNKSTQEMCIFWG